MTELHTLPPTIDSLANVGLLLCLSIVATCYMFKLVRCIINTLTG
jgi:hypothetical protein